MEWIFPLLRFRNKYIYCLGIRRSVRIGCWILLSIIIAMTVGILIVCFTLSRPKHPCHFGLKRMTKSTIVSGSRPHSIALADFNNDQRIDMVVANSGTNTIGIFLSQGNGMFSEQELYATDPESHPCSVAVNHLNDDNYADIAVTNYATNNIGIFLGYGDGTFTDQTQFSTGSSHPLFITTGDVNNDNAIDLVIVNYGTNSVGVLLGYGNGSFQHHTNYSLDYDSLPHSLALGDFNNDSHLDIAVANSGTNNIGILLGYGNGTFGSQKIYTTLSNSHPSSLALGDFNHDDRLDIVVSNNGSGNVGIFLGRGDGSFEAQRIYLFDLHSHPEYITVGNLNEDNELDVVIVDSINDRVHILLGEGNGSFATITTYDTVSESSPVAVGVGDFNNNNQSDIVVVSYGTNKVLVLMDYRIKPFTRQDIYKTGAHAGLMVAVGDFDNDGIPDIVATFEGHFFMLNGVEDGTFEERSMFITSTFVELIVCICVGDVNNDNWMDIVTANTFDDSVGVLLGRGNGTFSSMTTYSTGNGSKPLYVALGDLNDDNRIDIVSANSGTGCVGILLGNGDGTFATMTPLNLGPVISLISVAVGDIDNDHRLDIVVTGAIGYVLVFSWCDTRGCTLRGIHQLSTSILSMVLADFNNDDYLDIAVTNTVDQNVVVSLGYGNGAFAEQTTYPISFIGQSLYLIVADFNNDQIPDLATTVQNYDEVVIFYGNGNGSFTLARRYSTGFGSRPMGIASAYFNHQKQLKIVVTLRGTHEIAVLTEYNAAEFVGQVVYSTGSTAQPYSVAAGDFNHDNISDVVVANSGTDDLSVLPGSYNGTFDKGMVYGLDADSQSRYVITCDVNQDQQLDMVSVEAKSNSITVLMGQSDGSFANQKVYSTGNNSHPSAVASADLNNDGWVDLVTANEGTDSIGVFFGFNYTTFQSPVMYASNDSLQLFGVVASDLNNDRFQDIAALFCISNKIGIYLGCGNGSFILTWIYSIGDGTQPSAILVSDMNNDGQADIIVSNYGTNDIGILLGYGDGRFASVKKYPSGGSHPRSMVVGDMNNDNRLDIVVANYDSGNVVILYGNGDGSFPTMHLWFAEQNLRPSSITVGDLNHDGILDVLIVDDFADSTVSVGFGYGDGVLPDPANSSTIANCQSRRVAVADFNNDSQLDVAAAIYNGGYVVIFLANGHGIFGHGVRYLRPHPHPNSIFASEHPILLKFSGELCPMIGISQ